MKSGGFFDELKRRNVYRVAVAYAVVAWLLVQVASILLPTFEAPAWTMKVLVAAVAFGFPIALVLAWVFEWTPAGIQRTSAQDTVTGKAKPRFSRGIFWSLAAVGAAVTLLLGFLFVPRSALPSGRRGLAVLPFESLSEDKADAYFADGIHDEIITRLAKIGELKVISRTSTLPYREKRQRVPQIGRELGVAHVVEGSAQRVGDRVRVNVQLVKTDTDEHLWDPVYGPIAEEFLAMIETHVGEHDRAVARLQRLLTIPYGPFPVTLPSLRLDPFWDPLRKHPSFEKLVAGPEPATIH